jgi:hypothetical protein
MPPKKSSQEVIAVYVRHFFRFFGGFVLILGAALFLFRFTATGEMSP